MNRFGAYFGYHHRPLRIEVEGGAFELRALKREGEDFFSYRRLCFIDEKTKEERILSDYIRRMHPFLEQGVACSLFFPRGDRRILLFFNKEGRVIEAKGYIKDQNRLFYAMEGAVHCCWRQWENRLLMESGGKVYFEEEFFRVVPQEPSGAPIDYNYEGGLMEDGSHSDEDSDGV